MFFILQYVDYLSGREWSAYTRCLSYVRTVFRLYVFIDSCMDYLWAGVAFIQTCQAVDYSYHHLLWSFYCNDLFLVSLNLFVLLVVWRYAVFFFSSFLHFILQSFLSFFLSFIVFFSYISIFLLSSISPCDCTYQSVSLCLHTCVL